MAAGLSEDSTRSRRAARLMLSFFVIRGRTSDGRKRRCDRRGRRARGPRGISRTGRRGAPVILEQEGENSLGGHASWSLGGLFFVGSPEQRRVRIRDNRELVRQDWLGSDRVEDHCRTIDTPEDASARACVRLRAPRPYLAPLRDHSSGGNIIFS